MSEDETPRAAPGSGDGSASGRIFINYRREDSSGFAGRLFDRLVAEFGADRVFMAVDSIEPGLDFVTILEEWVTQCDVLLALIGPGWLEAADREGRPKLRDPNDFVRIEIRSALANGKRVIPVLVDNAAIPRADGPATSGTETGADTPNRRQDALETFRDCPECPEMLVIPAGAFQMGSPDGEGGDDEHPRHQVDILRSFAIGRTEVTFDQWDTCVSAGGCDRKPEDEGWGRVGRPVIDVSWEDAGQYVAWLSKKTGKPYRLPTEAEWEYAARAGTDTAWSFGGDEDELGKHAWYGANSGSKTHPVGEKEPNPRGLYDVYGSAKPNVGRMPAGRCAGSSWDR